MKSISFYLTVILAAAALVLAYGGILEAKTAADSAPPERLMLFSFEGRAPIEGWRAVNDTTMGGLSDSSLTRSSRGKAVFEGNLSLANDGGFASVRGDVTEGELAAYDGLVIRVKGDGRQYMLMAKTNEDDDGYRFQAMIPTVKDEWTLVKVPFKDFQPHYRGMRLRLWDNLDAHEIESVGLMIADEVEGPFRLEIDTIEAYRD